MIDVKLPEIGDGIESGDVLEVLVHEGDVIAKDQGVVELETDKATLEVPSSHAGKVVKVHVSEGDTVPIGGLLISVELDTSATSASHATPTADTRNVQPTQSSPSTKVRETASQEPPREPAPVQPVAERFPSPNPTPVVRQPAPASKSRSIGAAKLIAAGPAIRRFAREVGVDLSLVTGSGEGGRVTRDDVLAVVRNVSQASRAAVESKAPADAPGDRAADEWGPIRIEKMSRIRKTIARQMHTSWSTVPRVTNFDDADVTDLQNLRQASKADYARKGIKLTALPFVIKSVAMALRANPLVNASIDTENDQIIYRDYVNVGIAVDSARGLVVPSLRDADDKSIPDIARELAAMATRVRDGEISLEDLRGSTFTISNLGAIGGTYSTPIVNVPEVAILLVGRSRQMPVVVNEEIAIRLMMPLSMSYDHRLVDGATAARFLNDVIGYLKAPSRLLLAP